MISVASGKGGTGKTLVAVNLALSIGKAQLLDCDVEEPNSHLFLDIKETTVRDVTIQIPRIDKSKCDWCKKCAEFCEFNALAVFSDDVMVFEELCHGCGGCSMVCPKGAISYVPRHLGTVLFSKGEGGLEHVRGVLDIGEPKATPVVKAVKASASKDVPVIIDVSPGAGCPVVESLRDVDYCVLVTEPTPFGIHDLRIAMALCRALRLDFGVVVNKDGIGNDEVDRLCKAESVPILMRIPFDLEITRTSAMGKPLVKAIPRWTEDFRRMFEDIRKRVGDAK